jgi:hypothetical protein
MAPPGGPPAGGVDGRPQADNRATMATAARVARGEDCDTTETPAPLDDDPAGLLFAQGLFSVEHNACPSAIQGACVQAPFEGVVDSGARL